MNNEEKKAINNLNFIIVTDVYDNEVSIDKTKIINEYNESVGIVLNLIRKQAKEIEDKKEEIYAIARANYILGQTDERSQWYKKIDKMIESYKKLDKEEFAKQGNFDVEIGVLEELKRKEE